MCQEIAGILWVLRIDSLPDFPIFAAWFHISKNYLHVVGSRAEYKEAKDYFFEILHRGGGVEKNGGRWCGLWFWRTFECTSNSSQGLDQSLLDFSAGTERLQYELGVVLNLYKSFTS